MRYFAGIDLGGTNVKGGIVDSDNNILYTRSLKTKPERGFDAVAQDICELIESITKEAGVDIEYVGIGSPGAVDSIKGIVYFAGNLYWENAFLADYVQNKLNKKVYLANDANCAALGEYLSLSDNNLKSMAMITIGTGVGFGFIYEGKMYTGATYGGCEFGHTTLILNGEQCTCGKKGCIEAYASFTALVRDAEQYIIENPNGKLAKIKNEKGNIGGKILFEEAINNNEEAVFIVDRFLEYIGAGVVNIVNILDPEMIVIGGGISNSSDYFIPKIENYVKENAFCKQVKPPKIRVATSGNDVGIIGAGRLGEFL